MNARTFGAWLLVAGCAAAPARQPPAVVSAPSDERQAELPSEVPPDAPDARKIVAELAPASPRDSRAFIADQQRLEQVTTLNDPRAADELARYAAAKPHPYFETRAALALAALGDLRAVPFLARRLQWDPLELYGDTHDFEQRLRRDDSERVAAARAVGELLELHPEAQASVLGHAELAVLSWIDARPTPHANGMRALALMKSPEGAIRLRKWANPPLPLPTVNAAPPVPEEWIVAQSAQRYVGLLRDAQSWNVLEQGLSQRPTRIDASMNGLNASGAFILGISLRSLAMGGADGLSEWGDARAFAPLLAHAEHRLNNEESRLSACRALAWVGSDDELRGLAVRIASRSDAILDSDTTLGPCLVEALLQRPVPELSPLVLLFRANQLRPQLVRAIARSPLDRATERQLLDMARIDPAARDIATLGLMLGGTPDAAATALQAYEHSSWSDSTEGLRKLWRPSFDFVSRDDVKNGSLLRAVENAIAVAAVTIGGKPQDWALQDLKDQLRALRFDNGPHSVTRPLLNQQLMAAARGTEQRAAALAVRTLGLLGEPGMLLTLASAGGITGRRAAAAYRELASEPPVRAEP